MKKFLSSLLIIFVLFSMCTVTAFAETDYIKNTVKIDDTSDKTEKDVENNDKKDIPEYYFISEYQFLKDFIKKAPNRETGTDGEKKSAEFLADFFKSQKLETYNGSFLQQFKIETKTKTYESQNVIGVKKSKKANAKTIIIGGHYDNFTLKDTSPIMKYLVEDANVASQGVYNNASGIASMAGIINQIKDKEFDFNIMFACFGGASYDYAGAKSMLNSMDSNFKNNIELMINIDSIGIGDNLYVYSDEVSTDLEKFVINENKDALTVLPKDKKVFSLSGYFKTDTYSHRFLLSDNSVFLKNGIQSLFFTGYSASHILKGNKETQNKPDINLTQKDNLEYIEKVYGDLLQKRIISVKDIVLKTLQTKDIEKIISDSKVKSDKTQWLKFFSDGTFVSIVSILIKGLLLILIFVVGQKAYKDMKAFASKPPTPPTVEVDKEDIIVFKDMGI